MKELLIKEGIKLILMAILSIFAWEKVTPDPEPVVEYRERVVTVLDTVVVPEVVTVEKYITQRDTIIDYISDTDTVYKYVQNEIPYYNSYDWIEGDYWRGKIGAWAIAPVDSLYMENFEYDNMQWYLSSQLRMDIRKEKEYIAKSNWKRGFLLGVAGGYVTAEGVRLIYNWIK